MEPTLAPNVFLLTKWFCQYLDKYSGEQHDCMSCQIRHDINYSIRQAVSKILHTLMEQKCT